MKRARHKQGSVVCDKRRRVWNYLFCENGVRRTKLIGTISDLPTKAKAWRVAESISGSLEKSASSTTTVSVKELVEQYRIEKMPARIDTRRTYGAWLTNHIVPRWGELRLTEVQARP